MVVSLRKPGFTFAEVVDILMVLFKVHESKKDTFISRLQQLQKSGLPSGANVGRGSKVRYLNWQLADLTLYLDLLDCGVPPLLIKEHFGAKPSYYSSAGVGFWVQNSGKDSHEPIFLVIQFSALAYYQSGDPDVRSPSFADHILKQRQRAAPDKSSSLEEAVTEHPAVAINMTDRLLSLRAAVETVYPDRLDDITFYMTRSGTYVDLEVGNGA